MNLKLKAQTGQQGYSGNTIKSSFGTILQNMPRSFLLSFLLTLYFIVTISYEIANESDENDDAKDDETLAIPADEDPKIMSNCSRGLLNNVHEIRRASNSQFPYVTALMSPEDEYVCAGSIVSDRIILTTAECAEKANYSLINTTTAKKGKTLDINILHITRKEKFPTNDKNVALLYVEKLTNPISKISISNFTKAEKVESAEAIGFGLNTEIGQPKKLQYVGLFVKNAGDTSNAFIKCTDTTIPSCYKDRGGPVIVNNELVGVVTDGASECALEITSNYDINKHMLNFINTYVFKAWLDEKIKKNNENLDSVKTFDTRRHFAPVSTGKSLMIKTSPALLIYLLFIIL